MEKKILICVITVSDTRTSETDESGPAAAGALEALGYNTSITLVQDDMCAIQDEIRLLAGTCQAIFTTGGTGFAPRDITPEATAELLDRRADSLSELMRLKGLDHTPLSHLSRGVAGVVGTTLVVNLPGSPKAAKQGIEALAPLLPSILSNLAGNGCPGQ